MMITFSKVLNTLKAFQPNARCKKLGSCAHKSKEEGKVQESIQSSTTPDPEHHMGK